jgi:hypothetical protein
VRLRLMVDTGLHLMLDTAHPGMSRRDRGRGWPGHARGVELMEQRYYTKMKVVASAARPYGSGRALRGAVMWKLAP